MYKLKKILFVRNFASEVNLSTYNLQEVGFGKALVRKGIDCDIVYYTKKDSREETIYNYGENCLRILWRPAIKVLSNGIFVPLLKKGFIKSYDYIISTEYNQIMTYLLSSKYKNKIILYHGPYRDNNNRFIQNVYDNIFSKSISTNINSIFVKSLLAKEYLVGKGFRDIKQLGVGLDLENIDNPNIGEIDIIREKYLSALSDKKVLLYIGKLEDRRNIKFLLELIAYISLKEDNFVLLLIGDGNEADIKKYFQYAKELDVLNKIIHIPKIKQKNLRVFYESADIFVFPTEYDIFGMVLLESMYFGLPVISTKNGGSNTLIRNEENGFIIPELNLETWSKIILDLSKDKILYNSIAEKAIKTISENYQWDKLVEKFIKQLN